MPAHSWLEHVANGEAFSAENFLIGAGGVLVHLQLFNPAASGIRVRLRSVHVTGIIALAANVRRHDTPLTTLGLPAGFIVENLLGGQPVSVAEMRSQAPVAALGTTIWQISAPGSQPAIYPPEGNEWGFDLLEGEGLLLQAAAGATLIAMWQWVEVPL